METNLPLTLEEVRTATKAVVAENGEDFIYNPCNRDGCFYVPVSHYWFPYYADLESVPDGAHQSGCLVGEVLSRLGRLTFEIANSTATVGALIARGDLKVTEEAGSYFRNLQTVQDRGGTWGEALHVAERRKNEGNKK